VKTWLFTTLHRTFLLARRRHGRFIHHHLEAVVDELPAVAPELGRQADHSQVLLALAHVDELFQAAVALFYLEDWSYKEIAAILEIPIGTVKSRIARGVRQLREILLSDGRASESARVEWAISASPAQEPPGDSQILNRSLRV